MFMACTHRRYSVINCAIKNTSLLRIFLEIKLKFTSNKDRILQSSQFILQNHLALIFPYSFMIFIPNSCAYKIFPNICPQNENIKHLPVAHKIIDLGNIIILTFLRRYLRTRAVSKLIAMILLMILQV